jgi:L-lactate utilization protein LutC
MNFLKKLFSPTIENNDNTQDTLTTTLECLSFDENFVQNFIGKGGKFLYCSHQEELNQNLLNIINENQWRNVVCFDDDLNKILTIIGVNGTGKIEKSTPFFTYCERLLSKEGSVLFSSEQLYNNKIAHLPDYFIVFAKTSQIVKNKGEGLMGIKETYQKNFPTNISSIKSYMPEKVEDDFLSFGNNNAKNLYLLLLEDM